ncbi:restriction endonuclease subunit S, partial [Helicobacter cappadocius]
MLINISGGGGLVEYKTLGEVVSKNTFKQIGASELESMVITGGNVRLLPSSKNDNWWTNENISKDYLCEGEVITLGRARYANIKYHNGKFVSSNNCTITPKNKSQVLAKYLYYFIANHAEKFYVSTSTYPKLDSAIFDNFKIPIPPLPIQEEIVKILDTFTELEG